MNREQLVEQLVRHEGLRLFPYQDTVGKVTIGCGRNLADVGISKDEALNMLGHDIDRAAMAASKYGWFNSLNDTRQGVVTNMIFNMGANSFGAFVGMISHLAKGEYGKAADEMLNSKWAKQVGARANELANQMRMG